MKAKLCIHTPENQINRDIYDGEEVTIGRSPMCSLPIRDKKLSRIHAKIYYEQDHFFIIDNNSTNGTFVNTTKINIPYALKNQDIIFMGDTKIQFLMNVVKNELKEKENSVPQEFDTYKLLEEVGAGGLGVVYRALNTATNEIVAIKILKKEAASDQMMVRRFLKEARACANLSHPALLKVYDIGIVAERPFLVSEYVPGASVSALIRKYGPFEPILALKIIKEIAGALAYSHKLGIIHRDIKPSNILAVLKPLKVKLIDMGMVKLLNESGFTIVGDTLGTPRYMPPEQIEDASAVNHKADIYSLGATLYHMLAGVPPYNDIRIKQLGQLLEYFVSNPPEPIEKLAVIPKEVVELVHIAMARNPKDRFTDAKAFAQAIDKVLQKI